MEQIRWISIIISSCFLLNLKIYAVMNVVYNLRIAETTKRIADDISKQRITIGVSFSQFRNKYDGSQRLGTGGLASFIYLPGSFYFRCDGAFAYVQENKNDMHDARVQTDDLLFSGGYGYKIDEQKKLTFSGLLGIPTHKDTSLERVQFGYAQVGVGVQVDGIFFYVDNHALSIRTAVRCIHFFARKVPVFLEERQQQFTFSDGTLIDFFIAHNARFGHHNRIEFGCNPSFLQGSSIHPFLADITKKTNYIRSSFYANYKRLFFVRDVSNAVAASIS